MTDTKDFSATDPAGLPGEGQFFQVGNYAPVADELTSTDCPSRAPFRPSSTAGTCATDPTHARPPPIGSPVTA